LEFLTQLVNSFSRDPFRVSKVLERWYHEEPDEFTQLGLRHLAHAETGMGERGLARVVTRRRHYYDVLMDPGFLSDDEAVIAAKMLSNIDPNFFIEVNRTAERPYTREMILRTIFIVDRLRRADLVVPWLRQMSEHAEELIRASAAKLLARQSNSPQFIERHLSSPDPRVRANVLEALWGLDTMASRVLLNRASEDSNNRVVGNALYGLYLLKTHAIVDRILSYVESPRAEMRASVAWVMGETADPVFRAALEFLAADGDPNVCRAAQAALPKLKIEAAPVAAEPTSEPAAEPREFQRPEEIAPYSSAPMLWTH
jgi:hypothetical protein